MPATYKIDLELGIVRSVASGVLTDDDCDEHVEALRNDPLFKPSMDQLIDFTGVTEIRVSAGAVQRVARRNPFGKGARRAFVIVDDAVYGMARMYDSFTSRQPHNLVIFRDMAQAVDWLGLKP
jgi:hypothetical protein